MKSSRYPLAFLFKPSGEIDFPSGLRIIFILAVPPLVGQLMGLANLGLEVGALGFLIAIADVGGFYTIRARNLLFTTLASAFSLWVGQLCTGIVWLKFPLVFCWLFAAGYLSVYGNTGVLAGVVVGLLFLYGISITNDANLPLIGLSGGIWAMFVCLAMWPIQPYQPLRQAIADCYLALSQYVQGVRYHQQSFSVNPQEVQSAANFRQTLQQARLILSVNRLGRLGFSQLGELAIVLIGQAEELMVIIATWIEFVAVHQAFSQLITIKLLAEDVLEEIALITRNIAKKCLNRSVSIDLDNLKRISQAIAQQKDLHRRAMGEQDGLIAIAQLERLLDKLIRYLERITNSLTSEPPSSLIKSSAATTQNAQSWLTPLQTNWTFSSSFLRHGLRLAIATTIGTIFVSLLPMPTAFWVVLTVVIVLRSEIGITYERFWHRVAGTVLGVVVAPGLPLVIANPSVLQGIGILTAGIGYALRQFHYGMAVFGFSVYSIILFQHVHPASIEAIALWRLLSTLIGAGLAFLAAFVLFREQEQVELLEDLAEAINSSRRYFQAVMAVYLGEPLNSPKISHEFQQTLLTYYNAQASLQRFSNDPQAKLKQIEPAMTIIIYLRRFNRAVSLMSSQLEYFSGSQLHPQLDTFVRQVEQVLTQLAQALREGTAPPPISSLDALLEAIATNLKDLASQQQTSTHQVLRDYSIVATELEAISDRLNILHCTIRRFQDFNYNKQQG